MRFHDGFALAGFAATLLVTASAGADVVSIGASKDNTLFQNNFDVDPPPSNGAGKNLYAGRSLQGEGQDRKRAVLAFNVAAFVPAGSTINTATLTLRVNRSNQAGTTPVTIHLLVADWGEAGSSASGGGGEGADAETGDATWLHTFYPDGFWMNAGGDFVGTASATTSVGGEGFYDWTSTQLAADVQGWLDSPATNFGWIVLGDESLVPSAKRYDSREANQAERRPLLTIDFTPASQEGACCDEQGNCTLLIEDDCLAAGGEFQGAGTVCDPNPCLVPEGACCFLDGTCLELTETDCSAQGGTYQGDDTGCDPNPCPQPTGACCLPDGNCNVTTADECLGLGGTYQGDDTVCEPCLCPVVLTPYVDPLPIPGVLAPDSGTPGGAATYTIGMSEFSQQLHRDLPATTVWGYEGSYPGPTIEAGRDLPITVNWVNNLPATHFLPVDTCAHGADDDSSRAVVHLHGGHVPAEFDGYPEDTFLPGFFDVYDYPNNQLPATLWYHDHALGITRLNVYMGLAAFYLLRDQFELDLGLPDGEYEIPVVIQDRSFNPDGSWCYPPVWEELFLGNTILVNGKAWPFLEVKQATYRLRLLNGSNTRTYTLALSNGATFNQIGTDGGLLPAPVVLPEITLGPAERADVMLDFSAYAPGTEIILTNSAPAPFPGPAGEGVIPEIMKFIVTDETGPVIPVPDELRPLEVLQEADAIRTREFILRKQPEPCAGTTWLINDLGWDDITEFPRLDTTEIWSFVNVSGMMHPMHMHLVMFQVLDRQNFELQDGEIVPVGDPIPPAPNEIGWKDTVRADPGQITRVITRFENYTGLFAYHCHILEHEDHEMMRQFQALPACPWDLNHDDLVGTDDFLGLLAQWGTDPGGPPDFDGDGTVGTTDFLELLANWGPCPM